MTGGFRTEAGMAEAIESGDCDAVGIARPTVLDASGAHSILARRSDALVTRDIKVPLRRAVCRVTDPAAIESVLTIGWHTDQLHRMGDGPSPDPGRGRLLTVAAMLRRNGRITLNPRRGTR